MDEYYDVSPRNAGIGWIVAGVCLLLVVVCIVAFVPSASAAGGCGGA
jgi:hypothetical protein